MRDWTQKEHAEYFVQTYADNILRICIAYGLSKEDGFDICQNIYIKLFQKNISFTSIEQERSYIRKMAVNACKDICKSWHFKKRTPIDTSIPLPYKDGEYEKIEMLEILRNLPTKYREILYFCCIEGLTTEETAILIGKSTSCVRKRLSRARNMMKIEMGDMYATK